VGALVRDRERADLLDLVIEELQAQCRVRRGREDVDDAAAHRELAAARDHVDARVGEPGQRLRQVRQVHAVTRAQHDRLEVAQALDERLQRSAHGSDDDAQRLPVRL
jgi:hypothetical protein